MFEAARRFAVFLLSGFAYSSHLYWGRQSVERALQFKSKIPEVPWIFLPQAFGPFHQMEPECRKLFAGSIVYARDPKSHSHLDELNHANPGFDLRQGPDITWTFPTDVERGAELLRDAGLSTDAPIIGISPNMRIFERDPKYIERLKRYIAVAENLAQIVVLPHEISDRFRDDRWICKQLGKPALVGKHTAEELRGAIGCLDLLIGSRFHALLGALSLGVPVYAIGWASKYEELLGEFGLHRYVVKEDGSRMSR